MAYIQTNKNQNWLLPMSISDMIPKDHICFLVEDFVENLDYTNFDMKYDGAGIQKAKKEIKDTAQKKISLSDSESRMMKTEKSYVEPSYLGFREFLLRGLDKVKIELNIACIAHNLQKMSEGLKSWGLK